MGTTYYAVEGESYATVNDYPRTFRGTVTPGFFAIFEIPELRGRVFDERDTQEAPQVVVVEFHDAPGRFHAFLPHPLQGFRTPVAVHERFEFRVILGRVPEAMQPDGFDQRADIFLAVNI